MKKFFATASFRWFAAFAGVYALAMAVVFWGTWSLDRAPVAPDNPITYAVNDGVQWLKRVWAGERFIPSDLMHIIGGMYFWQELQYALAGFLAALGAVFYLRGKRLPLLAAYCGGASYGLMGYTFTLYSAGHLGWFIWMMYGPFAFGLTDRAVRKGKWINWALLGTVLAWSSAQQSDMWLLFTTMTFCYGLWCLAMRARAHRILKRPFGWPRVLAGTCLTAAIALATGMPQFSHALFHDIASRREQQAQTRASTTDKSTPVSSEEKWNFCTSWSLPPEDTLEFAVADIHGGSNDPRVSPTNPYRGRLGQRVVVPAGAKGRHPVTGEPVKGGDVIWMPYRQHSLYFGILALVMAGVGMVGWLRRRHAPETAPVPPQEDWRDVPFWIGAAALVYLCALGGFTPFYRLVFALPFGDVMRCPVKFVHLLEWCVAILAGFGFAALVRRLAAWRGGGWIVAAIALVNVADLVRVDHRYLAVEDLTFRKAPNAAAEEVLRRGCGSVQVLVPVQQGGALISDNFGLRLVPTTSDSTQARFLFATANTLREKPELNESIKAGRLNVAGLYTFSQKGGFVRTEQPSHAQAVLLQVVGKDPPPPETAPTPDRVKQLLTLLSILASCGVCAWALVAL